MGLIDIIGFIGTPGIAGLLVAGMCEDKVTGSAVRHYTQGAFSPIRPIIPIIPIIPMFAFSRPILTDYERTGFFIPFFRFPLDIP